LPATRLAFNGLSDEREAESEMVALRGFGPNTVLAWLREMEELRQTLAA
jgi:hypothetical protein